MNTHQTSKVDASQLIHHTLCDEYLVEERVTNGGMAWVYRAKHTQQGTHWAVKVLFDHYVDEATTRRRFFQEATIQQELQHPNIVHVIQHIQEDRLAGFIMEWCNAGDLEVWLKQHNRPLSQQELDLFLPPLMDALIYAHSKGIILRDLKPSNILLHDEHGKLTPKLSDFGIAKVLDQTSHTREGSSMGTYTYMAPEQAEDSKTVDARADVYSLGILLYRMTTGRLPYPEQGNLNDIIRKIQLGTPPAPSEAPAGLRSLIVQSLEIDPDKRIQSVEEMKQRYFSAQGFYGQEYPTTVNPTDIDQEALAALLGETLALGEQTEITPPTHIDELLRSVKPNNTLPSPTHYPLQTTGLTSKHPPKLLFWFVMVSVIIMTFVGLWVGYQKYIAPPAYDGYMKPMPREQADIPQPPRMTPKKSP